MECRPLKYHPKVEDDIPQLDAPTRHRIQAAIEPRLATALEEFAKPLAYTLAGTWSLRVGHWRVIFALRGDEVWILRIAYRREVYERLDRGVLPV